MQVREIMHENPACCTPDTKLSDVAQLMVQHDCGAIPVTESARNKRPVGMVTDRDITCRLVAQGINPLEKTAGDCMTSPCITPSADQSLEECCQIMEDHKIRRIAVVDDQGSCCGMVSQADIALHAPKEETAEVVCEVSQPASGSRSW